LNHRKKMIAEPSQLIPQKPLENVEFLFVNTTWVTRISLLLCAI